MIDNQDLEFFKDYGMSVDTEKHGMHEYLILKKHNDPHSEYDTMADEFVSVITDKGYTVAFVNFDENKIAFKDESVSDKDVFNSHAQEFIEENFGNPFADYHKELMREMGAFDAHATAVEEEDLSSDLMENNVEKAAKRFCERALVSPNDERLLEHTE